MKKPPAEKRTQSLRGQYDRNTSSQPGHKGTTLRQSAAPDYVIHHYPEVCDGCGAALLANMSERTVARQVIDLPAPPPPEVTERRAHLCRCGQCEAVTRGVFPEDVLGPVKYGPRIASIASYLQTYHCLPEERLALALSDLFGLSAASATLVRLIGRTADRLQPFAKAVCNLLSGPQIAVGHLDLDCQGGGKNTVATRDLLAAPKQFSGLFAQRGPSDGGLWSCCTQPLGSIF